MLKLVICLDVNASLIIEVRPAEGSSMTVILNHVMSLEQAAVLMGMKHLVAYVMLDTLDIFVVKKLIPAFLFHVNTVMLHA